VSPQGSPIHASSLCVTARAGNGGIASQPLMSAMLLEPFVELSGRAEVLSDSIKSRIFPWSWHLPRRSACTRIRVRSGGAKIGDRKTH
jgi:hypothetical protein